MEITFNQVAEQIIKQEQARNEAVEVEKDARYRSEADIYHDQYALEDEVDAAKEEARNAYNDLQATEDELCELQAEVDTSLDEVWGIVREYDSIQDEDLREWAEGAVDRLMEVFNSFPVVSNAAYAQHAASDFEAYWTEQDEIDFSETSEGIAYHTVAEEVTLQEAE